MLLTNYREFGGNPNDSITNHFNKSKYENQDLVLRFMIEEGEELSIGGISTDIITGEVIGNRITKKKDSFVWSSDLEYYIQKYNFMPDDSFINYVLSQTKTA